MLWPVLLRKDFDHQESAYSAERKACPAVQTVPLQCRRTQVAKQRSQRKAAAACACIRWRDSLLIEPLRQTARNVESASLPLSVAAALRVRQLRHNLIEVEAGWLLTGRKLFEAAQPFRYV